MPNHPVPLTTLDGETVELSSGQLDELSTRIDGRLLHPDDPLWDDAVLLWNGLITKRPGLVVQPMSARDVAATINIARDHRLLLGVKGGGHNIGGTSIAEGGLMLDMSQINDVIVDAPTKRAHVGAGCRLGDLDRAAQANGLATPLGFISEVGIAGLTLGGGLGYLIRRFGWSVDNLDEVEIVTADGAIRTASRAEDPDLFWGVRGAGANLGAVTRLTFRLHEVGPIVHGGLIAWPFEDADVVVGAYRELTAEAPRDLAVWLVLLRAPAAPFVPEEWHGRQLCAMAVCYSGDLAHTDDVLARIRRLPPPVFDLLAPRPYTEVQSYLDQTEPKGQHYYWRTEYVASLSDDLLATLTDMFADCPIPAGDIGVLHIGGALNERAADDGAVGNRDAHFVIGVKGMWAPGAEDGAAYEQWVRTSGDRIRPFSTGGTYINFQTADEGPERIRATYRHNLDRLVRVKKEYDPGNLFRSNRNIPASM